MAVATFDTHAAVKALAKADIARLEAKIDGVKWGIGLLAALAVTMDERRLWLGII